MGGLLENGVRAGYADGAGAGRLKHAGDGKIIGCSSTRDHLLEKNLRRSRAALRLRSWRFRARSPMPRKTSPVLQGRPGRFDESPQNGCRPRRNERPAVALKETSSPGGCRAAADYRGSRGKPLIVSEGCWNQRLPVRSANPGGRIMARWRRRGARATTPASPPHRREQ